MFPEMLQQEKKECGSMQSETGVSAPVANTSPCRNWAENRQKKTPKTKRTNQTAPAPCFLLAAALRCVEHCWGQSCVCLKGGSLLCCGVLLNPQGMKSWLFPINECFGCHLKPAVVGYSSFLVFLFPGSCSCCVWFWGGQPPSDLHACRVMQDYFYLMNNSAPRCWVLF